MLYFLLILLILFVIWPLIREPVLRWFNSFMSRRAEDMIRRMMGMPSRKEERRQRKQREKDQARNRGTKGSPRSGTSEVHPAAMMKQVAVDVEYTEIKEFESRTSVEQEGDKTKIIYEEQVTDAEFIEIKKDLSH